MIEKKGSPEGLKAAIIGDIMHSRVAQSNIYLLNKMGAEIMVAGRQHLFQSILKKHMVFA